MAEGGTRNNRVSLRGNASSSSFHHRDAYISSALLYQYCILSRYSHQPGSREVTNKPPFPASILAHRIATTLPTPYDPHSPWIASKILLKTADYNHSRYHVLVKVRGSRLRATTNVSQLQVVLTYRAHQVESSPKPCQYFIPRSRSRGGQSSTVHLGRC